MIKIPTSFIHGLCPGSLLIPVIAILESYCIPEVKLLLQRKGGKRLYITSLLVNLQNVVFLGALTYYTAHDHICTDRQLSIPERISCILGIVAIQGVLYFWIHKSFHEIKSLWWMHRFHHKFNTVVLPSSANAVSVAEFVFAYMTPLLIGSAVTRSDIFSALFATSIIGIANLLIHFPFLDGQWPVSHESESSFPTWIFVSTRDHITHHRHNGNAHYAAPVFHFDRIFSRKKVKFTD
jgi:sterol desaturase/sphingolipid hydroxylase (fatty acid hydroxylase superfamily)